ncbi:ACT domain-containing protein [Azohydromonas australica]|uniref:ACT domain-containing protein n=1 Tax=Azohydromonas australica TaxID=364039 RepID=UPI000A024417|nr:ACT domain-containing protein [Azohydromonas australica]
MPDTTSGALVSFQPGTFVFCTFPGEGVPAGLAPIATFRESEGLSSNLALDEAQRAGVPYQFESGLITLTIHSSLDAAEFLAAVSAVLADAGLLCKAVSACHHVHFFLPRERAQRPLISTRGGCSAGVDSWSGKGTVKLKAPRVHRRGEQQHQPEKRPPQKSVPCPLRLFAHSKSTVAFWYRIEHSSAANERLFLPRGQHLQVNPRC